MPVTVITLAVGAAGGALALVRWLRVAQREHYLTGSASRFAWRWWRTGPVNAALAVVALAGAVGTWWWTAAGILTGLAVAVGPIGLTLRGRTSPLRWTRRLRTLAVTSVVLAGAAIGGLAALGAPAAGAVVVALFVPVVVDAACALTAPLERRLLRPHVIRAGARLERIRPTVVAITGSFGKTSTKGYVAHLLAARFSVVASPASYNNRAGLARAVNEHLAEGTDVFVAEMGTYGPGEISELCTWIPPDVAVITAVGPVHLERFGSEERILTAKAEILERAAVVVLAIDDDRLAALADRAEAGGKRVWRCSATTDAAGAAPRGTGGAPRATGGAPRGTGGAGRAEAARTLERHVRAACRADGTVGVWAGADELPGTVPAHARAANVACAVAVALEQGVSPAEIGARLATLPAAAHRLEPTVGSGGGTVLDDTYNANPAGAHVALRELAAAGDNGGRRVLVTPGMVELGRRQGPENTRFAAAAAHVVTDLVVVGSTNRRALLAGASRSGRVGTGGAGADSGPTPRVITVATRDQAVAWVRDHVGPGDAVLYENDLPDHYP